MLRIYKRSVLPTKIRFERGFNYYKGVNSEGDKMFVNCW